MKQELTLYITLHHDLMVRMNKSKNQMGFHKMPLVDFLELAFYGSLFMLEHEPENYVTLIQCLAEGIASVQKN